jgi:chemosensory pili system protein ChpA (sensor histidine kinase/response regulator)
MGVGRAGETDLFCEVADEIRRLLHQFAAGFLKPVPEALLLRLADHESWPAEPSRSPALIESGQIDSLSEQPDLEANEDEIDAVDSIDDELLSVFREESDELLPQLQSSMRDWLADPQDRAAAEGCLRALHTFKGGARLAGAMRLGEMAHRMETGIERLLGGTTISGPAIELLQSRLDQLVAGVEGLRHVQPTEPAAAAEVISQPPPTVSSPLPLAAQSLRPVDAAVDRAEAEIGPADESSVPPSAIDWGRFSLAPPEAIAAPVGSGPGGVVRVRAGLLDRLVNGAGEVSIARARIETDVRQMQGSLGDLTETLDRMRRELRDIELQAETQIGARIEAAKAAAQAFDPLEMDRFTRLQELTRMMAESVNDVATLQRGLQRTLQSTEDQLAAQARQARELQEDLLRTRMVEFESLSERLYRVVRQAAKDSGKLVRLDIVGGSIEVDRGVLERMIGPFEHMLRNSVVHGIESADLRQVAGKEPTGSITVRVTHTANEVGVEFGDDGAGLDLPRILQRARERGVVAPDADPGAAELSQMIFMPGFSTAQSVTALAGRGIGMDVVRSEVTAMGGRIETETEAGRGTRFRLVLPLTTAVTQIVMLRAGRTTVAVPSTLVELVRRVPTEEVEQAYISGRLRQGEEDIPLHWLPSLLEGDARPPMEGRTQAVMIIRSAAQRVAVHIDEVLGNQEVVVKHLGPQLSRMPGLTGVTLLPSGAVALIYNPVALAALYGSEQASPSPRRGVPAGALPAPELAPLVMVVDDSLTVRRVTQRLLEREGYRVLLAKDGVEALERLADARPVVILCDIEMPRMDGFELVRSLRDDAQRKSIPVIMITSRIAQKHREHAAQLGVRHYLGKPFSEAELLALVAQYAGRHAESATALQYS